MTIDERVTTICNHIFALTFALTHADALESVYFTVQPGWTALHTSMNAHQANEPAPAGVRNFKVTDFQLRLFVPGLGKVMDLNIANGTSTVWLQPGSWQHELFNLEPESHDPDAFRAVVTKARAWQSSDERPPVPAAEDAWDPSNWPAREARCRRRAHKCGLRLNKSRREMDRGLFALIDTDTNLIIYGSNGSGLYDATLEDIEEVLTNA